MICRRIQSLSIRSAAPKLSGRMRPMSITVRLALLAVIAVVFPAIARAADQSPFDDTVFGNWGGLRSGLYDDGIALGIEYKRDFGYVEGGAYQINPNWLTRRYAFTFNNPGGTTGALIPAEVGWEPTFGPAQLKGSYKFGDFTCRQSS